MCNVSGIIFGVTNLKSKEIVEKRILEIGSRDVNGSLRPIIESLNPAEYIDIDIEKERDVDLICPAEDMLQIFEKESDDMKNIFADCTFKKIEKDRMGPGVFMIARKPKDFIEKDLSSYTLYSIVVRKRVNDIDDKSIDYSRRRIYRDKINAKKIRRGLLKVISRIIPITSKNR